MQYTHKLLGQCFRKLASRVKPTDASKLFEEPAELLKAADELGFSMFNLAILKQILSFINLLTVEERKLIALRASNICWKLISREFKCHRITACYRWEKALNKICHLLNTFRT